MSFAVIVRLVLPMRLLTNSLFPEAMLVVLKAI